MLKHIAIAAILGLLVNVGTAFAETERPVILFWTDCQAYPQDSAQKFSIAMQSEWDITVYHVCSETGGELKTKQDYKDFQKRAGMSGYQVLFIVEESDYLYPSALYDAYTYPAEKVGFYDIEWAWDTYLFSHEVLHQYLYDASDGDFNCYIKAIHGHYYKQGGYTADAFAGTTESNGFIMTHYLQVMKRFEC